MGLSLELRDADKKAAALAGEEVQHVLEHPRGLPPSEETQPRPRGGRQGQSCQARLSAGHLGHQISPEAVQLAQDQAALTRKLGVN